MGLDMYLRKRTWIGEYGEPCDDPQRMSVAADHLEEHGFPEAAFLRRMAEHNIRADRVTYITERIAYWKNFHALDAWFFRNTDGGGNGSSLYISRDTLQVLVEEIGEALKEPARLEDLFPRPDVGTDDGYHGSAEWLDDLAGVAELCRDVLTEPGDEGFEYESSW